YERPPSIRWAKPRIAMDREVLEEFEHGLQTERARLHGIAHEVRLEVPGVRVDAQSRACPSQSGGPAIRPEAGDFVEHADSCGAGTLGRAWRNLDTIAAGGAECPHVCFG